MKTLEDSSSAVITSVDDIHLIISIDSVGEAHRADQVNLFSEEEERITSIIGSGDAKTADTSSFISVC